MLACNHVNTSMHFKHSYTSLTHTQREGKGKKRKVSQGSIKSSWAEFLFITNEGYKRDKYSLCTDDRDHFLVVGHVDSEVPQAGEKSSCR